MQVDTNHAESRRNAGLLVIRNGCVRTGWWRRQGFELFNQPIEKNRLFHERKIIPHIIPHTSSKCSLDWCITHNGPDQKYWTYLRGTANQTNMDKKVSVEIRSHLKALRGEAFRKASVELFNIFPIFVGDKFTKGVVSEKIIRESIKLSETNCRLLFSDCLNQIPKISSSTEAYILIEDAIYSHFSELECEVRHARGNPVSANTLLLAQDMLRDVRQRLDHLLGEYRETFIRNAVKPAKSNAGRKPKYEWDKASNEIWGKIFRGDLIPNKQADIESALIEYLAKGDEEPGESTVRPYARRIWIQFEREA